jgi:signal transduction histidine kinase
MALNNNTQMTISEQQAQTITDLSTVILTPLDVEQTARMALKYLQQATQASFLIISILPANETRTLFPNFRMAWDGNKHSLTELDDLRLRVSTEKQPAIAELAGLAVIMLPVGAQDQIYGDLALGWEGTIPADFDLKFVELLLKVIGPALRNALDYHAQQYYIQSLEYLGGLSTELNILSDAQELISRGEHIACVLLNVEHALVLLVTNNIIRKLHSGGLSQGFAEQIEGTDLSLFGFDLSEPTSDVNRTITIEDVELAKIPELWRDGFRQDGVKAGIMSLLRGHKQILGCLGVFYNKPYTPVAYEIRLVEILADQIAVALDNIQLDAVNRKHTEMLEARVADRTRALALALDKAEDADRLKTQLLSTVSHELRTPLAVIKAHTTTILGYYDRLPKDRQMHYLSTMNDEADRLTALINSLLDMSRLETGQLQIKTLRFEPMSLLDPLIEILRARYTERQISWSASMPLGDVVADTERVRQIVSNLVDNAVKYSPANAPIEVGARGWEDGLEIWVKDEGNGMTHEQKRRVFDRFYQIEGSSQNARSGFGLGLAICKGLIEQMGGRIWCESSGPGLGSRFAFILPWAHEEQST